MILQFVCARIIFLLVEISTVLPPRQHITASIFQKYGQRTNSVGQKSREGEVFTTIADSWAVTQIYWIKMFLEPAFEKCILFRRFLHEFKLQSLFKMCMQFFSVEVTRTEPSQCGHFYKYYLTDKTMSMVEYLDFF